MEIINNPIIITKIQIHTHAIHELSTILSPGAVENMSDSNDLLKQTLNIIEDFCKHEAETNGKKGAEAIASYIQSISAITSVMLNSIYREFNAAGAEFEPKAFLDAFHEQLKRNYEKLYGKLK